MGGATPVGVRILPLLHRLLGGRRSWWGCDTAMLPQRLGIRHSWWLRPMPDAQESEAALESAESGYA